MGAGAKFTWTYRDAPIAPAIGLAISFLATHALAQQSDSILNVQQPGVRVYWVAGPTVGREYRDVLMSHSATATLSVGLATRGLAGSFWAAREVGHDGDAFEALVAYSYKLPLVDAHLGYAVCHVDDYAGTCPDGPRLTLSSNAIRRVTLEGTLDWGVSHRGDDAQSLSVTGDVYRSETWNLSLRAGWHRREIDDLHFGGASVRVIGSYPLRERANIDIAIGHVWNHGAIKDVGPAHGLTASILLGQRF